MSAIEYTTGVRLCGLCSSVAVHELLESHWTPDHGVVDTYQCASQGHTWQESRLPLDDTRNVNPRARKQPIKPRRVQI